MPSVHVHALPLGSNNRDASDSSDVILRTCSIGTSDMGEERSGHKSDDVFRKMRELCDGGLSMDAIARSLPGNGCVETMQRECRHRDLVCRRTGPYSSPINEAEIVVLYQQGYSLRRLAKRFNVSDGTISAHLDRNGVARRARGSSRGASNGRWKGGVHITANGHILRKSPTHPHRNRLGYVPEHRLVVEAALGGFLLPGEVVHHEDHDPANNQLDNLRIFCGHDEHNLYGHPERLWGISRQKVTAMLKRIRKLRSQRRGMLDATDKAARRRLRRIEQYYAIRARMVVGEGSKYVRIPTKLNGRRQEHEHRRVMASVISRELLRQERVHHEDGDRSNNSRDNLCLFRCNSDHVAYRCWKGIEHFRGKLLANTFLAEKCSGMHNEWPPAAKRIAKPKPRRR